MSPSAPHLAIQRFNDHARSLGWLFALAPAGDFERPELAQAFALWREKSAGRAMPQRADMSARAMKAWMANMSLLERIGEGRAARYRVRLHGSRLARYTSDKSGKYLDETVDRDDAQSYAAVYDLVLDQQYPVRLHIQYRAPAISYLIGESFVAPLARPDGGTPLILSVTFIKPRNEVVEPSVAGAHA